MSLRYLARRCGTLLLGATAALLVMAVPAAAGTTGKFVGSTANGTKVQIDGHQVPTALLGLELEDGTMLDTYCVELDVNARKGAELAESPWSKYPDDGAEFNVHPEKVLWILHNSYPNVALDKLGAKVGVTLDKAEAIAATQAAIWHFSNGANLDVGNPDNIRALYAYLIGPENKGVAEQPPVSLSITPATGEAKVGKAAGPFTVDTTASSVELTVEGPDGVAVVDADGAPLKQIADGTKFWLSAPPGNATGTATVKAVANAEVEKGRLFVGVDNDAHPTQSLIVAASAKTNAKAEAAAKWVAAPPATTTAPPASTTPPPVSTTPPLPNTGASVLPVLGAGLLLLGAGIGALLLRQRYRRRTG